MDEMERKPGFRINHNGTSHDEAIVGGFKLYAKEQFDDVYILALASLLKDKDVDWKYDALHQMIVILETKIHELEEKLTQKSVKKEGPKTFGEKKNE